MRQSTPSFARPHGQLPEACAAPEPDELASEESLGAGARRRVQDSAVLPEPRSISVVPAAVANSGAADREARDGCGRRPLSQRTPAQVSQAKVLNCIRAAARMQVMTDMPCSRCPSDDSARMVQKIAATLADPGSYQSECQAVFGLLREPARESAEPGTETYELPLDRCAEVLAHWGIPEEHVSLLWALLRKEILHIDDHELPRAISYETFSNVLVKVLRRVRDKHTSLKVTRLRFITQSSRRLEDEYAERDYIGAGSFGQCRWMEHRTSKEKFVCKMIKKNTSVPDEEIQAELDVMRHLDHPNVLRVYQWFEMEDCFAFILEAAAGGDLKHQVVQARDRGQPGLPEFFVRHVAHQGLCALSYIHASGVVHRDIKPANMLLEHRLCQPPTLADCEKVRVLIADFGVSELFKSTDEACAMRGTLPYMAPEVFEGHAGPRADIWALGVVVQEIIGGKRPFQGDSQMAFYVNIRRQEPDITPLLEANASESAVDFVRSLLTKERAIRPLAKNALEHVWLAEEGARHIFGTRKLRRGLKQNARMSTVAQAVASCIAAHVNSSQVEELARIFESLDTDHDGVLSHTELERGLKEGGICQADITLLVDSADINHDGKIDYTEFVASLLGTQGHLEDDMLERAFAVFDANADGSISLEELHEMLNSGGPLQALLPDGTTVESVLDTIDSSHDGSISKQEFFEYLSLQHKLAKDGNCHSHKHSHRSIASRRVSGRVAAAAWDSAVPGGTPLSALFAQFGVTLRDAPHPVGAVAAPDYATLCARHAHRLAEEHWMFTAQDLRDLRPSDWQHLCLPLKLQTVLQARLELPG